MDQKTAKYWAQQALWENRRQILDDACVHTDCCNVMKAHEAFLALVGWTVGGLLAADLLNAPGTLVWVES